MTELSASPWNAMTSSLLPLSSDVPVGRRDSARAQAAAAPRQPVKLCYGDVETSSVVRQAP